MESKRVESYAVHYETSPRSSITRGSGSLRRTIGLLLLFCGIGPHGLAFILHACGPTLFQLTNYPAMDQFA